jgi:two-component system cell cycle response regulator DivK
VGERAERRRLVAVVEDNRDNRLLIRAILEDRYRIDEYARGTEALAGFATRLPDLILLDISLPEMDGLEVLAQLRGDAALRGRPVIALTAHAMAGDRERYLAAGFDDYVSKPLTDEAILLEAIARLLAA